MSLESAIAASRAILTDRLGGSRADTAILLGSGWGAAADAVRDAVDIPYVDLPE